MKNIIKKSSVILLLLALLISYSCEKDKDLNNPFDKNNTLKPEDWSAKDLQIENISVIKKKLTWGVKNEKIEGFIIGRRINNQTWEEEIVRLSKEQREWIDTIVPDTSYTYEYKVTVYAGQNLSSPVQQSSRVVYPQPAGFNVAFNNLKFVELSWQYTLTDNEGFRIRRRAGANPWAIVAELPASQFTFNDTSFQQNSTLQYQISAYRQTYISQVSEKTISATIPPPANFQITKNNFTSVTLYWTKPIEGAEGYKIERKYETTVWSELATTTATEYMDEDFEMNRTVSYRIFTLGNSAQSIPAENQFNSSIPCPENLLLTPQSAGSLTLSWQYTSQGHEGFRIDRKVNNDIWQVGYAQVLPTQLNYFETGLDLLSNTYTYRIYVYSGQITSPVVESIISKPEISTTSASNISPNSAISGGSITVQGNYQITERGICWSPTSNPTIANDKLKIGSGVGNFSGTITGLTYTTQYYIRAYSISLLGTHYGNEQQFTTTFDCGNNFTDIRDGRIYSTVKIGTQCWMKTNLNIGTSIDGSSNQTNNNIIEKYCYNNTVTSCLTHGGLYQWNEMMQYTTTPGVQGICPSGWHIPTDAEWTILTNYLGGESVAGGKMKETGTTYWDDPNLGATNSSGFTALPGGCRWETGSGFNYIRHVGHLWSSTAYNTTEAGYLWLSNGFTNSFLSHRTKDFGYSVRCLRE